MRKTLLIALSLVLLNICKAQNPYESLGIKDVKVLTLSNGKYNEFFNNDTIVRIGSVMLNTITNKIVSFVDKDSLESTTGFEPQLVSRWVSPDPLAEKYIAWSPYNYGMNNPIKFVDIDGRDVVILIAKEGAGGLGHMGAIIQDGNGDWYYMTQGAADPNGNVSNMTSGGVQGGMSLVPLGTKDKDEAIAIAKQDQNNSPYTDQVEFKTSSEMDANIFESAQNQQEETNSGEKKYNLLTNNCVDAVQDPIEEGTGVNLPKDVDPRPNKYFEKLQKKQAKVQKKIDRQVQKQQERQQKKEEENNQI